MSTELRQCPLCKEEIKLEATKCKHCHSMIASEKPAHEGTCPFCKESIKPDAVKCKHCKSSLNQNSETCNCQQPEQPILRAMLAAPVRLGYGDNGFGQDCFYDCIDEHVAHGDDANSAGLHRYCENSCSISMPRLQRFHSYFGLRRF